MLILIFSMNKRNNNFLAKNIWKAKEIKIWKNLKKQKKLRIKKLELKQEKHDQYIL